MRITRREFAGGIAAAAAVSIAPASAGAKSAVRWSAAGLKAFRAKALELGIRALVVRSAGETILSFGDVATPYRIASIRKSFLGALFGIAVEQKKISLDVSLKDLGIDDYLRLTDAEKTATVRQLLQSRSGIYLPTAAESPAMIAARPPRGSRAPGTHWWYNNWDFNALGEIYQRLTSQGLYTAMEHLLLRPLGFRDLDPVNHLRLVYNSDAPRFPAYDMMMSSRDMAAFGEMILNQGRHKGRKIVSESWIVESTRVHSVTGHPPGLFSGYGYMWWVTATSPPTGSSAVPLPSYTAAGAGGRFIVVLPSLGTVAAMQPHTDPTPTPRGITLRPYETPTELIALLAAASRER